MTLDALAEVYNNQNSRKNKSADSKNRVSKKIHILQEILGKDKTVRSVTTEDLQHAVELLPFITKNSARSKPDTYNVLKDIERGKKHPTECIGSKTLGDINSEEISDLQIPVPTLAEQERIIAEIESRFERADALETAVDRALSDAEKLKQAVLKKAFRGELVPQNPDDEPASVLLDRIRAARASELPAKKGKRKKTEVDSQL